MKKSLSKCFAIALTVALAAGSISACSKGGGDTTQSQGTTAAKSETTTTAAGGDAAQPTGDSTKTLQLALVPEGTGDRVPTCWNNRTMQTNLLFRALFLAEPDLVNVKPDLAESYEISDDGLTYTIVMKEGLKWSDGEALTADDVAFSIKANLKAAVSNGIYTSAFTKIEGGQEWKDGAADLAGLKVDGNTITITLTDPYASFIPVLAQFAILPEHILKDADPLELHNNDYWIKPVGSGMYMVDEMSTGNYFSMVPNPHYEGQAPKIQKVVSYWVSDYITTAQAGKLDYVFTNATDQISEIGKLAYMQKNPVDILFYRYFICNMEGVDGNENPVMKDPRVREALLYAIDREELAKGMFPDLATVINSGVPNEYPEYNGKTYEYNPEKAKQLLEEAGYDFNHTFRILYYYTDQTSIDFMDAIAYYLEQVGMKVETVQSQQGTVDLFQTRNYDVGYKGLSAFTISEWFGEYQSANANFAQIFGGDTQFDDLISQLGSETDAAKRSDLLKQLQELEQKNLYKIPLYTIGNVIFLNTDHVSLPEGVTFCNPWYRCDVDFENWEIK